MAAYVPIAMVGCGGMGRRHLTGITALYHSDFRNIDLAAVCDLNRQNAEDLADEAAEQLGARPRVFTDLRQMTREMPGIQGADVVTDTGVHHRVSTDCLELGLNVQCEKPLAITMRGCNLAVETARRLGKVLSIAENHRRDPISRLGYALIHDGAIGTPQLLLEISVGGGDRLGLTPWRHRKLGGSLPLDAGVHNADMVQYYLGVAELAFGSGHLFEKLRYKRPSRPGAGGPGGFYSKWSDALPDFVEADGEDALFGYVKFRNGTVGQFTFHTAAHGQRMDGRYIYGSKGSLESHGDRNGRPFKLSFDDGNEVVGEEILDYAPSYKLSPVAAQLFGGERLWTYPFSFTETDAKILALEYHEFAECILTGQQPEVDGTMAQHDLAFINAMYESGVLGRAVTLEEVERVEVDAYQREIDQQLGLI
jgi:predicted dehydrogenase